MTSIGGGRALSLEADAGKLATSDLRSPPVEPCRSRLTKIGANYRRFASIQIRKRARPRLAPLDHHQHDAAHAGDDDAQNRRA